MARKKKNNNVTTVSVVPSVAPKAETVVISSTPVTTTQSTSQRKRRNRRRNRKNRKGNRSAPALRRNAELTYFDHQIAPDIFGPFRQPRMGASARTGLGFDQSEVTITGDATTNKVQGFILSTVFGGASLSGLSFALANELTLLSTGTGVGIDVQFPNVAQLADVNLTAASIVAYYTGNPLTVQGELIFGTSVPPAPTANYHSLYLMPGTVRIPVAQIIEKPMRVCLRKLSPIADEFVATNAGNADCDVPWVFSSGLPTGGTLKFLVTRTWEYRSTTVSADVIPYERVGNSHSEAVASYQDARADVAELNSTLTEALPGAYSSSLSSLLGYESALIGAGAAVHLRNRGNQISNSLRNGNRHPMNDYENMVPFQAYLAMNGRAVQDYDV